MATDQQMNIFMPGIFWHDRQPILSIDVLQQYPNATDNNQVYKIATASLQREIRAWNFRFTLEQSHQKPNQKSIASNVEPKVAPITLLTPKAKVECKSSEDDADIIVLDKENDEDVEMEDLQIVEPVPGKREDLQADQQCRQILDDHTASMQSLSVEFLANLEGHRSTTNIVRFSPNGDYLASGDADGTMLVWALQPWPEQNDLEKPNVNNGDKVKEENKEKNTQRKGPEMDIPPNKENWVRVNRATIHHDRNGDITGISFSPDSQFIASTSMYETLVVSRADNGKKLWTKSNYRHFANGIVWDPRGKYLVTLSTDRRMDVLDAQKGTMLRCCYQMELPTSHLAANNIEINQQSYKMFYDDQLWSFQRGVDFSPCGGVVFAPAAHLEVGAHNIYGTYAFRRADLSSCRPTALFPTVKPTIQVKCSPVLYKLEEGPNFLGLPHRMIFAVLCRESLLLYNSQYESPFVYMENLHYDKLTSMCWTPDGLILVVSSMEGFNSFIKMDPKKMGIPCERQSDYVIEQQGQQQAEQLTKTPVKSANNEEMPEVTAKPTPQQQQLPVISLPDSPKLITPRRPRPKKSLNTPQALDSTPKQQPMDCAKEAADAAVPSTAAQSPKMHVPKKKPRKVALVAAEVNAPDK